MDITKLDIKELKAIAYDQIIELQRIQANIKTVNNEIKLRQESEVKDNKKNKKSK